MKKGSKSPSSQPFLREHGEKLAFGLGAAIVVACLYFAFTRETYTAQPQELESSVQSISQRIESNDPAQAQELNTYVVREFAAVHTAVPVDFAEPDPDAPIGSPIYVAGQHKRGAPQILPVSDLVAVSAAYPIAHKLDPKDVATSAGNNEPGGGAPGGGLLGGAGAGGGGAALPGAPSGAGKGNNGNGLSPPGAGRGRNRGDNAGQPGEGLPLGGDLGGGAHPGGGVPLGGGGLAGAGGGLGGGNRKEARKGVQASPQSARPEGVRSIVVTAHVPKDKQIEMYEKLYTGARGNVSAKRMSPQYLIFDVERKDETTGGDWETKDAAGIELILANWKRQDDWAVNNVPEVINPTNTMPMKIGTFDGKRTLLGFTYPLPPILGQDWGPEFRGSFPAIGEMKKDDGAGEEEEDGGLFLPGDTGPALPGDTTRPGGGTPAPGGPGVPGGPGGIGPGGIGPGGPGIPGAPGGIGPGGVGPGGIGPGGPGIPGAPGGIGPGGIGPGGPGIPGAPGGIGPGGGAPPTPGAPGGVGGPPGGAPPTPGAPGGVGGPAGGAPPTPGAPGGVGGPGGGIPGNPAGGWGAPGTASDTDDFLLRFIDYTVEVGHRYRYRVRLRVENPNHGLPARYLEKPELANDPVLFSEWSEESKAVAVARHAEPLVGPASPANSQKADQVDVAIVQRDIETGATISHLFPNQERGQLLNKDVEIQKKARDWQQAVVAYENPFGIVAGIEVYGFRTDQLVLDLRGGDKLTAKSKDGDEPAEALLFDESGRVVLNSELDGDIGSRFGREEKRLKEMREDLSPDGEKKDDGDSSLPGFDFPPKGGGKPGSGPPNPGRPSAPGGIGGPGGAGPSPGRPGGGRPGPQGGGRDDS